MCQSANLSPKKKNSSKRWCLPIFVEDTKIVFGYSSVALLKLKKANLWSQKTNHQRSALDLIYSVVKRAKMEY